MLHLVAALQAAHDFSISIFEVLLTRIWVLDDLKAFFAIHAFESF